MVPAKKHLHDLHGMMPNSELVKQIHKHGIKYQRRSKKISCQIYAFENHMAPRYSIMLHKLDGASFVATTLT